MDFNLERKYFGLSRPENGKIIYKAAATELKAGELSRHGLEKFTIAKGNYIHIVVKAFRKNTPAMGTAFEKLTADKRIDPNGICVEWYLNESDCQCMVRIKDNQKPTANKRRNRIQKITPFLWFDKLAELLVSTPEVIQ